MMRNLIIGGLLLLSLSACNMTTARQSDEAQTLATSIPTVTPQPPFVTQALATQMPTSAPSLQNTGSSQQNEAASCTPINDGWQTYTVVAGDTLSQIAQQVALTTERLAQANCLQNVNSLTVGQTLLVPVLPNLVTVPDAGRLRIVGDFMGAPDLQSCWASNKGGTPLVYDAINGTPIAVLSNRVSVIAANTTEWIQVFLLGTKTIADTTGWMRTADVSLLGACTEVTGIEFESFRGQMFGNPAGVPNGTCAVAPVDASSTVAIYPEPNTTFREIGRMNGWGLWVSTQGNYHQVQFESYHTGSSPVTVLGWVDTATAQKVNC
jgi:LysM repeat protein